MNQKQFWQSKTVWWNLITLVLAVLALPEFISIIPISWTPVIGMLNGIGNLILRVYFTTQPVS